MTSRVALLVIRAVLKPGNRRESVRPPRPLSFRQFAALRLHQRVGTHSAPALGPWCGSTPDLHDRRDGFALCRIARARRGGGNALETLARPRQRSRQGVKMLLNSIIIQKPIHLIYTKYPQHQERESMTVPKYGDLDATSAGRKPTRETTTRMCVCLIQLVAGISINLVFVLRKCNPTAIHMFWRIKHNRSGCLTSFVAVFFFRNAADRGQRPSTRSVPALQGRTVDDMATTKRVLHFPPLHATSY